MAFRTLRTLKLIGKWRSLTETIDFLWRSFDDIFYFSVLLALFIFLFGVIGLTLFANKIKLNNEDEIDLVNGESIRVNFDNIGFALLAAFTLQIGDNWTIYFYQYTRFNKAAYVFFPITIFVLNVVILNLFVAIMLEKFFSDDQKEAIAEEEKRNREFNEKQKKINESLAQREIYSNREKTLLIALKVYSTILSLGLSCKKTISVKNKKMIGKSLNIFSDESALRLFIYKVMEHRAFVLTSYFFIAMNSVLITFYTPLRDPKGTTMRIINTLDIITTTFFCSEIIGKTIVCGFINNGPKSLLRVPFNILDVVVTLVDIVSNFVTFTPLIVNKIIMLIRVLRVLRLINMNQGFRLRIKAIIHGFPRIAQTIYITIMFIFMFAVVGVQLFKDRLYFCSTEDLSDSENIDTMYDCMNHGGEWQKQDVSFDDVIEGFLTLFELFTGKGWCNLITFLSDIYDYDHVPKRDYSTYNLWYPVIYMLFAFLCIRSLLTGVISNSFYYHNESLQGLRQLTSVQRRWVSFTKIIFKASPIKSYGPEFRFYKLYLFLSHPVFSYFILTIILLNGVVLCFSTYRPSPRLETICDVCHYVFIGIYALEAALKLLFYHRDYFDDGWNIFDLVVVVLLGVITCLFKITDLQIFMTLIYIVRAFKICALFHKIKVLHDVFYIFVLALPSVISLALLLFLMMYIFAMIGICLFSEIKLQGFLDEHANFQNLVPAFLTIFRLSTFDGWNNIMHDARRQQTPDFYCVYNPSYQDAELNDGRAIGCGLNYAFIYFVLSIFMIPFMFLNIFVAIVVASVMEIAQLSESVLSDERLSEFRKIWVKYDPRGKGYIEYYRVWNLLYEISEPLGAAESEMNNRYYSAITLWMLQLQIYRNQANGLHYVAFYDVLESLVKKCLYRPQTLDKIYNNISKSMLIKGLQELWDQRTQLSMDSETYMNRMEDLKYYYESKKNREMKSDYKLLKVNLPLLVWIILKISKYLRGKLKEMREEKSHDEKEIENPSLIMNSPSSPLLDSNERPKKKDNDASEESITTRELIARSITHELESLNLTVFGGQISAHNIPKLSEKIRRKKSNVAKPPKHNVPTDFQPNQSRFRRSANCPGLFDRRMVINVFDQNI